MQLAGNDVICILPQLYNSAYVQTSKKFFESSNIFLVWPTFRNAANQLKRTKGVTAEAVIAPHNVGRFCNSNLLNHIQIAAPFHTAGVKEKYIFPLRKILLRPIQHILMKFLIVNARSKANQIIAGRINL